MPGFGSRNHKIIEHGFFSDHALDFQTRSVLGRAVRGASEVGEVLATVARINGADDWAREWSATAKRVEAEANQARAAKHLVSASSGFLRAATYWACAVDGLTTLENSEELLATFQAHRRCWDAFIDCSQGAFVRISIPYETTSLPGYLLRPDASGQARPTLVVTNGSDGAISDLWTSAAAGALARGWNAFLYDGPGQQSLLFEEHTHFRPDWEAVLTPVVDALVSRSDIDAQRLAGYGISQGGYWLPRTLAYEHRFVAAIADPGVVDVSTSWTVHISKGMRSMLEKGDRVSFNRDMQVATHLPGLRRTLTWRSRPYQHEDWYDLYQAVQQYRLNSDQAALISTPLLITDPADEQFWPGQSRQLADLLPVRADLVAFSAEEGANYHCQPLGRLLTEERMFNWLEDFVG
ncbi:MAG: prolyl oligopeptidase family serine peptidase [Ktedonobacteraceae bacterium]|nr:prolyl oligopeptidase family serine peptidase [Ktedonobacteraceae bacterium]